MVANRTMQFEKQTAMLKSANANLVSELGACTQAGNALRKSADQLADFFHNAPCGYCSLDPDGVVVQINDNGLKWLARTRDEVVGKLKFADLLTPASTKAFLEHLQRFKESGGIHDLKLEIALPVARSACQSRLRSVISNITERLIT